ncbi:MAG: hypothetical protein AB1668_06935 [Nanoarchaeota archaeon]
MELRKLKEEVSRISDADESVKLLQKNLAEHINHSSLHSPNSLPPAIKKELKKKVSQMQSSLQEIEFSHSINDRLKDYARYLVELKLAGINNDKQKAAVIANFLHKDEFLKLQNISADINSITLAATTLLKEYDGVNEMIKKNLSLEENLLFSEFSHKKHLQNILDTARKQKKMVQLLEKHFISLTLFS